MTDNIYDNIYEVRRCEGVVTGHCIIVRRGNRTDVIYAGPIATIRHDDLKDKDVVFLNSVDYGIWSHHPVVLE